MARRKQPPKFDKKAIVESFAEMAREKKMDRDLLQNTVEEMFSTMVKKKYGPDANFDIIVNLDKGDIEIYLTRTIVDEVFDPATEISLDEVRIKSKDPYEMGEEFIEEITLDNISDTFGRRSVVQASQNLNQRIRDVEKDNIFSEYAEKVGEIVVGEIYQLRRSDLLIMINGIEMRMPREEQIPNERYKKNATIRALLKEVRRSGAAGLPDIILSRADEKFLSRLFELEIPEIYDGLIEIKAIAREPGERSKVAVVSYDERIDPVGACVGMKGIRIHSVVRELNNENIDIIEWAKDPKIFIARSLSPAKVRDIQLDAEHHAAVVTVPDDQVSLAIGRSGQNVRLASKLTGYSLSLIKEGGEDIELIEFKQELGAELYDQLINAGIDTAREFLEAEPEYLLSLPNLTKEQLIEVRALILDDFEEEENPENIERINSVDIDRLKYLASLREEPEAEIDQVSATVPSSESTDEVDGATAESDEPVVIESSQAQSTESSESQT